MKEIEDNFGCQQLLKDLAPQTHMIDIRIRLNGEYYWFEGDFLKRILPHVEFKRIEKDIECDLESHKEVKISEADLRQREYLENINKLPIGER